MEPLPYPGWMSPVLSLQISNSPHLSRTLKTQKSKKQSVSIMPTFSFPCYSLTLFRLVFCFLALSAKSISAFSFRKTSFDSEIALYGDARISNDGSSIILTPPLTSRSGLLTYNRGFRLLEATSFSTDFLFSISPGNGDGLALVLLPNDFASMLDSIPFELSRKIRFLGVEFDANRVGIDVGGLVFENAKNLSSANLFLNSGEKLRSWIDYNANSKKLEVWLSKFGNSRPNDPILSYTIDLSETSKGKEVFVGITASSGNSSQTSSVYSWSFRLRNLPNWFHSQPVDPRRESGKPLRMQKTRVSPLTFLARVIFGTGCLALISFVLLFVWAIFIGRHATAATEEELPKFTADFRYQKINNEEQNKNVD